MNEICLSEFHCGAPCGRTISFSHSTATVTSAGAAGTVKEGGLNLMLTIGSQLNPPAGSSSC